MKRKWSQGQCKTSVKLLICENLTCLAKLPKQITVLHIQCEEVSRGWLLHVTRAVKVIIKMEAKLQIPKLLSLEIDRRLSWNRNKEVDQWPI